MQDWPRPWEAAESIYASRLTAAASLRVMLDGSREGSLPPDLQRRQLDFIRQRLAAAALTPTGLGGEGLIEGLDLGCGTGSHVLGLAQDGWRLRGVDLNRPAVSRARHLFRAWRQSWSQADLNLPDGRQVAFAGIPPGSLAFVYMVYGTWSTLDPGARKELAATVANRLRPGGLFLLDALDIGPSARVQEAAATVQEAAATVQEAAAEDQKDAARRAEEPRLLSEHHEYNLPGGFWGLLPRRVLCQEWYYPEQTLMAEVYRLSGPRAVRTFIIWKQLFDPQALAAELVADSAGLLELQSLEAGSFSLDLRPEAKALGPGQGAWCTLVLARS